MPPSPETIPPPAERHVTESAQSGSDAKSLAGASLEIGRMLADRNGIVFRAKGKCMYPTIRAGDVLHIESRTAAEVNAGDIAVCRRPKYLLSHRVIEKGTKDGRAYIVTRPDGARESNDGPTFDENLLGVVVGIRRKGKPAPLQPVAYSWPQRRYFAFRFEMAEAAARVLPRLEKLLAVVQSGSFYRLAAKKCLSLRPPALKFTVRVPSPALGDAAYRQLAPEDFDARKDWRGRPVRRWTLVLNLNDAPQPAAWATFVRDGEDIWRVGESFVRGRYRGAGLDDALLRRAAEILLRGRESLLT